MLGAGSYIGAELRSDTVDLKSLHGPDKMAGFSEVKKNETLMKLLNKTYLHEDKSGQIFSLL